MEQAGSIFDDVDEARKARADIAAGRVVSHALVGQWLERMAKGERPPPPYSPTLPRQICGWNRP